MKQVPLIDDGHAAQLERDRGYELDRTPAAVCRQGLEWAIDNITSELGWDRIPATMIDIGAGSGVFGQQLLLAEFSGGLPFVPHRIAIEPRPEESPHLRRHYEQIALCTFAKWWTIHMSVVQVDPTRAWVACNPAFSIFPDIVRACAQVCVATLIYGSIAWGCSEAGAELFEAHPPVACARIVGRVHHRGPGLNPETGKPWGADQRDCCWWLWMRDHDPDRWSTENLPVLPPEQRRWIVAPGAEP